MMVIIIFRRNSRAGLSRRLGKTRPVSRAAKTTPPRIYLPPLYFLPTPLTLQLPLSVQIVWTSCPVWVPGRENHLATPRPARLKSNADQAGRAKRHALRSPNWPKRSCYNETV
ncbi:uncharacterized protein LOC103507237 [Diaphorina citri]|uniref:Uncharacterized protein LOC103507237 n=1 Tax=Diaphorina citri TaxID=121845 RepID=A0A3Q0ITH5_DIACI|nr:uncharacterized protein LOC103507237 [Diaphorina citri]